MLKKLIILFCFIPLFDNGELPVGWNVTGYKVENYNYGIDSKVFKSGLQSAYIESVSNSPDGFATLTQVFSAKPFIGDTVKLKAHIKANDISDCAAIWVRIDGREFDGERFNVIEFKDSCHIDMSGSSEWKEVYVEFKVPSDSNLIKIGVMLSGNGKMWADDLKIETLSKTKIIRQPKISSPINLDFED